jgi:hypothetical protein
MIDARYSDLIDRYAATRPGLITRTETVWVLRAYEPQMTLATAASIADEYTTLRDDGIPA